MKNQALADRVATLSEEQAALVKKFIDYIQSPRNIPDHDFQKTLDSFISEHSELLRRL